MRAAAYWFCQLTGAILGSAFVYAVRILLWLSRNIVRYQQGACCGRALCVVQVSLLAVLVLQVDRTGWHASTGGTNRLLPGISKVPTVHHLRASEDVSSQTCAAAICSQIATKPCRPQAG